MTIIGLKKITRLYHIYVIKFNTKVRSITFKINLEKSKNYLLEKSYYLKIGQRLKISTHDLEKCRVRT